MHPYRSKFCVIALLVYRLVADVGDSGEDIWLINGNNKNATLVRDTTTKEGAVSRIENSNIGVCNGLALFVDDGTRQMEVGLVNAFHGNHTISLGDTHGIETYDLTDSIR